MKVTWRSCGSSLPIIAAALFVFLPLLPAATITVSPGGGGNSDLQAAVDAAADGDTVLVEPGDYNLPQSLDLNRRGANPPRNLTVRSTGGAARTVLRLAAAPDPERAAVVVFRSGEDQRSVLEGFTLTGGQGFTAASPRGGGIFFSRSSPTIRDCLIHRNAAVWGAGIYVEAAFPRLIGCVISNNSATEGGGGVCADNPGGSATFPTFRDCRIVENLAREGGGVLSRGSSRPVLESSSLWGNRSRAGGAILSEGSSYPMVTNCLLAGNSSLDGGAVLTRGTAYPYFTNCTITDNLAGRGSGIACTDSSYPRITNCILWANRGGSLLLMGQAYPRVSFCAIEGGPLTGERNTALNPLFVHPGRIEDQGTEDPFDDRSTLGDYRLGRRSPAIDAGIASLTIDSGSPLKAPETDLDGNQRPCWNGFDLGAYEYCGADVPGPLPDIAFVSRALDLVDGPSGAVTRASRGGLYLLRTTTNEIHPLVDAASPGTPPDAPRDVLDPDVSYPGDRIVFSGYSEEEGAWRIYQVRVDGTGLQQVTRSDRQLDLARYGEAAREFERYDDLDPCYLPDGRICFVSTRYPESAPEGRSRATNLYLVNADGSGLRRLTSERFGADTPAVDPATGDIVFSRWWRTPEVRSGNGVVNPALPPEEPGSASPPPAVPPGSPRYGNQVDVPPPEQAQPGQIPRPSTFRDTVLVGVPEESFPGVNSWFLSSLRLDGTGLAMLTGFHLDRVATQAYRPSFLPDGDMLALFLTETPRAGRPGVFGLRRYHRGPSFPVAMGGPQDFESTGPDFRYHSAVNLPDGRILVSGARSGALLPGRFDLFVQDNQKDSVPAHLFGFEDRAELDAIPVISRDRPKPGAVPDTPPPVEAAPRDAPEAVRTGGTFTFQVDNIFSNAEVDAPLPNAPPLGKRLFIEFYMTPQRTSLLAADPPILLERLEVPASGKFQVELPAGVPLFEMLRRPDGTIASGRDGQIFHVGGLNYGTAGKKAVCVGCHAGHSMMEVPADASFTNLAPSAQVSASSSRQFADGALRPVLLVDRRTDFFRSEWAAAPEDPRPWVRLSWGVPIHAREVVIHGARTGSGVFGARNQTVNRVTVRTFLAGAARESWSFSQNITVDGAHLPLNEQLTVDTVELVLSAFSGTFEGGPGSALSEIEVIGRAVEGGTPAISYLRGDANCDAAVSLSDAIHLLGHLFLSEGPLCCTAGAEASGDGVVDVSDAVFLLAYLYRGGDLPPAPFPTCGRLAEGGLACDREACR